jgi:hypothetical protein
MAKQTSNFKRFLPIVMMAAALAESAHAPLISGVLAATPMGGSGKPAVTDSHSPSGADKKAAATWTAPPIADSRDPSAIREKLKQLQAEKHHDVWEGYPINPTALLPNPQANDPSDLLATVEADSPGSTGGAVGGGSVGGFEPDFPVPPATIVHFGNGAGLNPPAGSTDQPVTPVENSGAPLVGTPVPEPGMLSGLLGVLVLFLRPSRNKTCDD